MDILQNLLANAPLLIVFAGMFALVWRALSIAHDLSTLALQKPELQPTPAPAPQPKPAPAPAPLPAPAPPIQPKTPTEYDRMWAAMQIMPQHQAVVDRDAAKIMGNKARYEGVAQQCGVPWFVIGLIDQMEAGGGCKAHLHNGDPLDERTIHVPAGRPPAPAEPPFTWEQSALDALHYEGFDKVKAWPLATVAGELEKYNGMGYHMKGVPSPYLWSFSNQYTAGKFVKDHVYDPNAVSEQAGALPILKALMALDPSIQL